VDHARALQLFVREHAGAGAEDDAFADFRVVADADLAADDRARADDAGA